MGQKEDQKQSGGALTNDEELCSTVDSQKLDTIHKSDCSLDTEGDLVFCRVCHCTESDRRGDAALGFLNILPPLHEILRVTEGGDSTDKVPGKDVDKDAIHAKNHGESGIIEFISPEGEISVCSADIESGSYSQQDGLVSLGCSCKNELSLAHYACALKWFINHRSTKCEICGSVAKNVRLADYRKVKDSLKEYEALRTGTAAGEMTQVLAEANSAVDPEALAAVHRQRLSEISLWFNPHNGTITVPRETAELLANDDTENVTVENPTTKWTVEAIGILVVTGLLTVKLAWLIAAHVGKKTIGNGILFLLAGVCALTIVIFLIFCLRSLANSMN